MADLARIGIAIGESLLVEFDKPIAQRGYTSRSEAVRSDSAEGREAWPPHADCIREESAVSGKFDPIRLHSRHSIEPKGWPPGMDSDHDTDNLHRI
jgi:hypothetical protein